MSTMRAVQVSEPGGDFELVQKEIWEPAENEARVRMQACGVCPKRQWQKRGPLSISNILEFSDTKW